MSGVGQMRQFRLGSRSTGVLSTSVGVMLLSKIHGFLSVGERVK